MRYGKQNRRSFLKSTAALAGGVVAAPYVITSKALGAQGVLPASERVTVAHIGVGGRGSSHVGHVLNLDLGQIVAVCDPFKSRREQRAQQVNATYANKYGQGTYRSCEPYNDFRDVLARDDVDAIVVATPDHWHVPIGIAAARAGKDMYVEKPLGVSMEENQAMREAVLRYNRVFQYGTQQRAGRNFRHACELARNGRLGEVHLVHAWCAGGAAGGSTEPAPVPEGFDYDLWLGPAPKKPYTTDRCKNVGAYHIYDYALGFIAGWGAHPLDIAQWGLGTDDTAPIRYEGAGTIPSEGLFDTVKEWEVWCDYANGVKMRFMSTSVAQSVVSKYRPFRDHGTTFFGTEGWVSVDRGGIEAEPVSLLRETFGPNDVRLHPANDHMLDFLDSVKTRSSVANPVGTAVQSDFISHLSNIAIRTGRGIEWDPKQEQILNDPEAARNMTRVLRSPWHL